MARERGIIDALSGLRSASLGKSQKPKIKLSAGSGIKIGGNSVRHDGTRYTVPENGRRRQERRRKNRAAKVARRANR